MFLRRLILSTSARAYRACVKARFEYIRVYYPFIYNNLDQTAGCESGRYWRRLTAQPACLWLGVIPDDQGVNLKLILQSIGDRLRLLFRGKAAHMDPIATAHGQLNDLYPDI